MYDRVEADKLSNNRMAGIAGYIGYCYQIKYHKLLFCTLRIGEELLHLYSTLLCRHMFSEGLGEGEHVIDRKRDLKYSTYHTSSGMSILALPVHA